MTYLETKNKLFKNISYFGLYLFAISIPISFVPAEFGVVIAFIGWFLEGIVNKNWQFYNINIFYPLAFYILWNFIASILSPRPVHSLLALLDNEWPVLIMILMLWLIDDVKIIIRMVHLWLGSAFIATTYGIWQTFSGYQLHRPDPLGPMGYFYRAVGFNGFYLTFAGFAMTVFFVALSLSTQNEIRKRWKYIVVSISSILAIIGTFARSIWFSFLIGIPVFGIVKGKRVGKMILVIFLIVVILLLVFIPTIRERAISSFIPSENQTRLNLWKTSVNIFKDFPLLGIGQDNFDYYFNAYKVDGYYDVTGHPHNDYLNVLVSSGIPGLISFLLIWTLLIWKGFNTNKNAGDPLLKGLSLGGTLGIIGFLVGAMFQNYYGTFANCWGWWFVAGIIVTSYRLYKK